MHSHTHMCKVASECRSLAEYADGTLARVLCKLNAASSSALIAGSCDSQPAQEVELFSIDSNDESNVALFHPQPTAAAQLGFLYATKDGRIRAFRFDR